MNHQRELDLKNITKKPWCHPSKDRCVYPRVPEAKISHSQRTSTKTCLQPKWANTFQRCFWETRSDLALMHSVPKRLEVEKKKELQSENKNRGDKPHNTNVGEVDVQPIERHMLSPGDVINIIRKKWRTAVDYEVKVFLCAAQKSGNFLRR